MSSMDIATSNLIVPSWQETEAVRNRSGALLFVKMNVDIYEKP